MELLTFRVLPNKVVSDFAISTYEDPDIAVSDRRRDRKL